MFNPTRSTLLLLTPTSHLFLSFSFLSHFTEEATMQCFPSSVSLILLLFPYLSHSSHPSIGSFPLFHQGRGYISCYPAPSLSPTLFESLFSSISPSFSLIFLRDNCVQALSSFSSLKRRLPSRHREAESAFLSSVMSQTPSPSPQKHSHTHNKYSDIIGKAETTNYSVCLFLPSLTRETLTTRCHTRASGIST